MNTSKTWIRTEEFETIVFLHFLPSMIFNCDFFFQTVKQLAMRGHQIFIVDFNYRDSFLNILRFFLGARQRSDELHNHLSQALLERITVIGTVQCFPKSVTNRFWWLRKLEISINQWLILFILTRVTSRGLIWSFDVDAAPFFANQQLKKRFTTLFDCVDFYTSANKKWRDLITGRLNLIAKNADHFIVNSEVLFNFFNKKKANVYLVPQGFDETSFKNKQLSSSANKFLQKHRHLTTKVGYIGNLNYRLDYALLLQLITSRPDINFFFSSHFELDTIEDEQAKPWLHIEKLKAYPNVIWIPQLARSELAKIMSFFDVCMIPYDIHYDFNKYSYPMKLFEYFYVGKPVISTPIVELKRFKPYVKIAATKKEWLENLDKLLSNKWPASYQKEQRKLALTNSWSLKIDAILHHLGLENNEAKS